MEVMRLPGNDVCPWQAFFIRRGQEAGAKQKIKIENRNGKNQSGEKKNENTGYQIGRV